MFLQSASLTSATCCLFTMPKMLHYFPPLFSALLRFLTVSVTLCPKFYIVFPRGNGDHNVGDPSAPDGS